jgi:non-haem Fe2+, alpha-ketoglutarate-dependent halogenase
MNNQDIKVNLTDGGYYFPVKILDIKEALDLNNYYQETKKKAVSKNLIFEHKFKSHLIFKKINELIKNKKILDIVEGFIGPNILCWNSIIFYKKRYSKTFVGWHEDKTYWNLDNDKVLTFSIALSNSKTENGCLKFLKKKRSVEYEILKSKENMLARGQNAILNDKDSYENIELNPGEACIFGQDAVHGSGENQSNEDRFLLAIRYISVDNKTKNNHTTATLVRGIDNYKYYEPEPEPIKDFDTKCLAFHQKLMTKQTEIFAKYKLKKFKLSFLSFIVRAPYIRYLYYWLNKKI